jgi:hypothetical protein
LHGLIKKIRIAVVAFFFAIPFSHAQEYQKAKETLRAVANEDTYLMGSPSALGKRVAKLLKGSPVTIVGKKGGFLDLQYQNQRGWGAVRFFTIQSGSTPVTRPEIVSRPPVRQDMQPVREPRESRLHLPIRINPFLSYANKGKSFDRQFRLGASSTYALNANLSVGGVTDIVLLKGTYFSLGPIVRHQWNTNSDFFNPALYAGFLFYTFNHNSVSDRGFGFQTAIENDFNFFKQMELQPLITLKFGTDLMYFLFDDVRIPFFFAAGVTFKF